MTWYKRKKRKIILAQLSEQQGKFIEAQELLAEVVKGSAFADNSYYVGGSVRDELMGKVPDDLDIVVEEDGGGIAFISYLSSVLKLDRPTISGKFQTASVIIKRDIRYFIDKLHSSETRIYHVANVKVEAVQSRKEKYSNSNNGEKSHKPEKVEYAPLSVDAKRRDLTVNTLLKKVTSGPSYGSTPEEISKSAWKKANSGEIRDIISEATNGERSGLQDIENGIIETPDDPDAVYADDATRIIRAVRFAAKYHDLGWKMTDEIKEGIRNNLHELNEQGVAMEQYKNELMKMLKSGKMFEAIMLMDEVGLLEIMLPELKALQGVEQDTTYHSEGDAFQHTMLAVKNLQEKHPDADPATYLAVISHDWGKAVTQEFAEDGRIRFYGHESESGPMVYDRLREMKFPNDIADKVKKLVEMHMVFKDVRKWSDKTKKNKLTKLMRELGDDWDSLLSVIDSDEKAAVPKSGEKDYQSQYVADEAEKVRQMKPPDKSLINGYEIKNLIENRMGIEIEMGAHIGEIKRLADDILLSNLEWLKEGENVAKQKVIDAIFGEYLPQVKQILGGDHGLVQ